MPDNENGGSGVAAEFPPRIVHEFDGRKVRCTVEKQENGDFLVKAVPIPELDSEGKPVLEEVKAVKKDETGSEVQDENGNPVLETVLNEDGTPQTKEKLDPVSDRFVKFPADHDFSQAETWEEGDGV